MKNRTGEVKEKKIDFINLWKSFLNPEAEEISQEEILLKDENISEDDRKELLASLKSTERIANKMFKDSYKTVNLKAGKKLNKNSKIETKKVINQEKQDEQNIEDKEIEL